MNSVRTSARPWIRRVVAVAASSLLIASAGCSSGTDSGSDASGGGEVTAEQQECVDKAAEFIDARGGLLPESLPEDLTPHGEPPPEGLRIAQIQAGSIPTGIEHAENLIAAAEAIGWTGKMVTFDGSVEDLNEKATAAIDDFDVVFIDGQQVAALQGPIGAAKRKGVLLALGGLTEAPDSIPGYGAGPRGGDLFEKAGEMAAYRLMQSTNCQGKVAAFGLPAEPLRNMAAGMEKVLKAECPDCSFSYTDIAYTDVGTQAATNAVTSKLQSDPSVNFAFFTLGDIAVGIEPALAQAGVDVEIGGAFPKEANLASLEQGDNAFWLGLPTPMGAWLAIDTILRALESGEPVVGDQFPFTVLTADNLESSETEPVYPTDFKEQFLKLWQVS
jgi:ABC-type sugar transport system substrate-binding protein